MSPVLFVWQALLSLAGLGALGVIVRLILRPRLYLDHEGDRCRDDGLIVSDPWTNGGVTDALYLRLRVSDRGILATAAKGTGVFIERVVQFRKVLDAESTPLMWTDRGTYDRQIIDRGTHTFVDLCCIFRKAPEHLFLTSQKGTRVGPYPTGLYRIDVVVRAEWAWPERASFFIVHSGWSSTFLPLDGHTLASSNRVTDRRLSAVAPTLASIDKPSVPPQVTVEYVGDRWVFQNFSDTVAANVRARIEVPGTNHVLDLGPIQYVAKGQPVIASVETLVNGKVTYYQGGVPEFLRLALFSADIRKSWDDWTQVQNSEPIAVGDDSAWRHDEIEFVVECDYYDGTTAPSRRHVLTLNPRSGAAIGVRLSQPSPDESVS